MTQEQRNCIGLINLTADEAIKSIKETFSIGKGLAKRCLDELFDRAAHDMGPEFERKWRELQAQQGPAISTPAELLNVLTGGK